MSTQPIKFTTYLKYFVSHYSINKTVKSPHVDMELKKMDAPSSLMCEIFARVVIWSLFLYMELHAPFVRVIQPEEWWQYKYPHTGYQYVPASYLWMVSVMLPSTILIFDYLRTRNRACFRQGMLALTLLLGLNGLVTVLLKISVGRPRPDYYYRCWPNGTEDLNLACTGDARMVREGRKSFPSGHSSFSFASMLFLSLYLSGRLQIFEKCRGCAWRVAATGFPLIIASLIAISRTCDYHHHWQDVVCGAVIGAAIGYICYYQYFPSSTTSTTTMSRSSSTHTTHTSG